MRALLVVLLFAGGCDETFEPPELPDLYKRPYDFAVQVPGEDLSVPAHDMGMPPRDLSQPPQDLSTQDQ